VNIVIHHGLTKRKFVIQSPSRTTNFLFARVSRNNLGPAQNLNGAAPEVKLTTHIVFNTKFRMRAAVPLFTLYAIMVWDIINLTKIFMCVWSINNCSFLIADSVISKNLKVSDAVSIAGVIEH